MPGEHESSILIMRIKTKQNFEKTEKCSRCGEKSFGRGMGKGGGRGEERISKVMMFIFVSKVSLFGVSWWIRKAELVRGIKKKRERKKKLSILYIRTARGSQRIFLDPVKEGNPLKKMPPASDLTSVFLNHLHEDEDLKSISLRTTCPYNCHLYLFIISQQK